MRAFAEWVLKAEKQGLKVGEVVLREQAQELEISEEILLNKMRDNLQVMRDSVAQGLNGEARSLSGLVGGDAAKVERRRLQQGTLVGDTFNRVIAAALAVAEVNACMGKIVAAPTAGSCGVLPSVLLTIGERLQLEDDLPLLLALFTAAGLGMVIAERATIAGAEGGCQAEIGSAAAMAAAGVVELAGGSPSQCANAAAIAMKSLLGLVCDPVAGLVEVPCVKRNANAAVMALAAAEMALAGIRSAIPVDEVIDAMADIGGQMPCALKETAQGGLAITPTGLKIRDDLV